MSTTTTDPRDVIATHRHKKRGSEYVLIGIGRMQAEDWYKCEGSSENLSFEPVDVDMREVAIYRSVEDGSLWVRPREEFEDGRFEALTASGISIVPVANGDVGELVAEINKLCAEGGAFEGNAAGLNKALNLLCRREDTLRRAASTLESLAARAEAAEAANAELRAALEVVRTAIAEADPNVLTCTLWMPDHLSPNETAVDFIDAALTSTEDRT